MLYISFKVYVPLKNKRFCDKLVAVMLRKVRMIASLALNRPIFTDRLTRPGPRGPQN